MTDTKHTPAPELLEALKAIALVRHDKTHMVERFNTIEKVALAAIASVESDS